jgi:small redox-active disulfide protein 2
LIFGKISNYSIDRVLVFGYIAKYPISFIYTYFHGCGEAYIMKIQILGRGCPKCRLLEDHARHAVQQLGIQAEIEKVTDMDEILRFGVMMTPALAINGTVKASGKVLTTEQIVELLK